MAAAPGAVGLGTVQMQRALSIRTTGTPIEASSDNGGLKTSDNCGLKTSESGRSSIENKI